MMLHPKKIVLRSFSKIFFFWDTLVDKQAKQTSSRHHWAGSFPNRWLVRFKLNQLFSLKVRVLRKPLILKGLRYSGASVARVSDVRANDILVSRHAVTSDVTKINSKRQSHKMISARPIEEIATWRQGLVTRIQCPAKSLDN